VQKTDAKTSMGDLSAILAMAVNLPHTPSGQVKRMRNPAQ